MDNMQYCPRCAYINALWGSQQNCEYCNHVLIEVDFSYFEFREQLLRRGIPLGDAYIVFEEEYIKGNPEFSEEAKENRLRKERLNDLRRPMTTPSNKVKCPYCQSEDVKKITMVGRAVSVGLLGVASGKIGKQWHCNNCKSDF